MENRFYSNGKLLISGEYLVLDGVKAFALPTKGGQDLCVTPLTEPHIHWTSYDVDGEIWLEEILLLKAITTVSLSEETRILKEKNPLYATLLEVLQTAHLMNPQRLNSETGYRIETHLTFPRLWGLGTSSTWINNVAQWFEIDAFELLERSFGGSGYDIACAQHDTAITYRRTKGKPEVVAVDFNPSFKNNLYFVYLNQKQSSKAAIQKYREKQHGLTAAFTAVEQLTDELITTTDFTRFKILLVKHEELLKTILEEQTVQERLFPDFLGVIKSLGAWGGDFVLVASETNPTSYFQAKGYHTVVPYTDMILS